MHQRLFESARDADVGRLECAELVASHTRKLGKVNASLGIAREEFAVGFVKWSERRKKLRAERRCRWCGRLRSITRRQ